MFLSWVETSTIVLWSSRLSRLQPIQSPESQRWRRRRPCSASSVIPDHQQRRWPGTLEKASSSQPLLPVSLHFRLRIFHSEYPTADIPPLPPCDISPGGVCRIADHYSSFSSGFLGSVLLGRSNTLPRYIHCTYTVLVYVQFIYINRQQLHVSSSSYLSSLHIIPHNHTHHNPHNHHNNHNNHNTHSHARCCRMPRLALYRSPVIGYLLVALLPEASRWLTGHVTSQWVTRLLNYLRACCQQVLFLVLSVCLSAQNLQKLLITNWCNLVGICPW